MFFKSKDYGTGCSSLYFNYLRGHSIVTSIHHPGSPGSGFDYRNYRY